MLLHALAKKPEERFGSISDFARAFEQALLADSSSPTRASTLQEPDRSDIPTILVISEAEALTGTNRLLTLLGGEQVPVTVPAGTRNGQIIRVEGQVEPASEHDSPGALILPITIAAPEEQTFLSDATGDATVINSGSVTDAKGAGKLAPPSRATVSTETRNRRHGLTALLLVGLAVLVAVGSSVGVFYFTRSNQHNPYPPYGTLALDDPLSDNSHGYNWLEGGDSFGTCAFTGKAYHVNAILDNATKGCTASSHNFIDFAYEVQMTIVKGDGGGILFRDDDTKGNSYSFVIGQNGDYALWLFNNCNSNNCKVSEKHNGSNTAINKGLNQSNLVAVVATGSTIDLYVNNQKIYSVSDSSYSRGQIGVAAANLNGPTEVVFSNAKVWTFSG